MCVLIWEFKRSHICCLFICIGINVSNQNWRNLPWKKIPQNKVTWSDGRSNHWWCCQTTASLERLAFPRSPLGKKERKEKQSEWRKKEDKHALFHPSCLERLPALLSSFGAELRCLPSKIKPEKTPQEDPPSQPPPAGLAGVILLRLLRSALRYIKKKRRLGDINGKCGTASAAKAHLCPPFFLCLARGAEGLRIKVLLKSWDRDKARKR